MELWSEGGFAVFMLDAIKLENVSSRESSSNIIISSKYLTKLKKGCWCIHFMSIHFTYKKFQLASLQKYLQLNNFMLRVYLHCRFSTATSTYTHHATKMEIIAKLFAFLLTFSTNFTLKMEASMYPIISHDIKERSYITSFMHRYSWP